jgi:hypothetical protein
MARMPDTHRRQGLRPALGLGLGVEAAQQHGHDRSVGLIQPGQQLPATLTLQDPAQHPRQRPQSLVVSSSASSDANPSAAWASPPAAADRSSCCSPRRRLPAAASSRSRAVGRRRRGRPGQQASHGVGHRCPACGVHPSGPGVQDPAVQPSGVRSPRVVVRRVRRSAVCCPAVRCLAVRPDARSSPPMLRRWRWGPGRAGRATLTTRTGGGPGGLPGRRRLDDGPGGRDAGDAAHVALVRGRSVADPAAGLDAGRGGHA